MVVENNHDDILLDYQIWTNRQAMANQLDKVDKKAVLIDVAVPNDGNMR